MHVGRAALGRDADVSGDHASGRVGARIDVDLRRRCRIRCAAGPAQSLVRFLDELLGLVVEGVGHLLHGAALRRLGKPRPGQLFRHRVRPLDNKPVVYCPGRARADAPQAAVADVRIDHVVPLVADRLGGAARLARVAPDAGFRVDQVLPERHLSRLRAIRIIAPEPGTALPSDRRRDRPSVRRAVGTPLR